VGLHHLCVRRERGCSVGSGLALTEMALVAGWRRSPPSATPLPWAPSAVPSPKVTIARVALTAAYNTPCSQTPTNQTPPLGMRLRDAAFEVPSRFVVFLGAGFCFSRGFKSRVYQNGGGDWHSTMFLPSLLIWGIITPDQHSPYKDIVRSTGLPQRHP